MLLTIITATNIDGDEKTKFEQLYYKYRNLLFTYAKKIVKNDYDAEDVLQTALIKIAKNIKKIGELDSDTTISFLIVITKNTAYDFLKKSCQKHEIPIEKVNLTPADDQTIDNLVSKIDYDAAVMCIKSIPEPYRSVLFFHYVGDYSIKQTADILDRKFSTVKMQLVRGKKILIKLLSEVLYE